MVCDRNRAFDILHLIVIAGGGLGLHAGCCRRYHIVTKAGVRGLGDREEQRLPVCHRRQVDGRIVLQRVYRILIQLDEGGRRIRQDRRASGRDLDTGRNARDRDFSSVAHARVKRKRADIRGGKARSVHFNVNGFPFPVNHLVQRNLCISPLRVIDFHGTNHIARRRL